VQWVVLLLMAWVVVAIVSPVRLARTLPNDKRRPGTAGPWILGAVAIGWVLVGAMWGWTIGLDDSADSRARLAVETALLLGVPAALVSVNVWRAALSLPASGGTMSRSLPVSLAPVLAASVRDPSPLPDFPHVTVPVYNRWRRTGLGFAIVAVATGLGSVWLASAVPSASGGAGPLALVLVLVGAVAVMYVFRGRARIRARAARRGPSVPLVVASNGWLLTQDDDDDLVRAFPAAPFLRSAGHHDAVRQTRTVAALSGARYWWASEQRGQVTTGQSRQIHRVQSLWLVWLPGVRLSRVVITCRNEATERVGFLQRWGPSITLESIAFNERLLAFAQPGQQAQAVGILHPRMMELLTAELPDDAVLVIDQDWVCVWRAGPLSGQALGRQASLALRAADLIPGYILTDATLRAR